MQFTGNPGSPGVDWSERAYFLESRRPARNLNGRCSVYPSLNRLWKSGAPFGK